MSAPNAVAFSTSVRFQQLSLSNPIQGLENFNLSLNALRVGLTSDEIAIQWDAIAKELEKCPERIYKTEYCKPGNKEKNRECGIYPYDTNIVTTDGTHFNTKAVPYINASIVSIPEFSCNKFILTQAPLEHTVKDLFNVLIEKECHTLVALVMEKEPKKGAPGGFVTRCYPYWENEADLGMGYKLLPGKEIEKLAFEGTREAIIIRDLEIQKDGELFKTVRQYHYQNWPDHGTPVPAVFNAYCKLVEDIADKSTVITGHCHAGSGRTGVYFATWLVKDYIQKQLKSGKELDSIQINPAQLILEMKLSRQVLNNLEQYQFVLDWTKEYLRVLRH